MSLAALLSETVQILTFSDSATDRYGNPRPSWPEWGSGVTTTGRLEQIGRDENVTDRNTQIARWRLYLPAGTVITGRDRVHTSEGLMEVEGPPRRMRKPSGEHHVVAYLRQARDTPQSGS